MQNYKIIEAKVQSYSQSVSERVLPQTIHNCTRHKYEPAHEDAHKNRISHTFHHLQNSQSTTHEREKNNSKHQNKPSKYNNLHFSQRRPMATDNQNDIYTQDNGKNNNEKKIHEARVNEWVGKVQLVSTHLITNLFQAAFCRKLNQDDAWP